MHTNRFLATKPTERAKTRTCPQKRVTIARLKTDWDNDGQPVRQAKKARKAHCLRRQATMADDFVEERPKTRTVKKDCLKTRAVKKERTDNIKEEKRGIPSSASFYMLVCISYAFLYAYIFSLSALRTRLFSFLYALYAVNSGVMCSYKVHRFVFDCIQCIQTRKRGGDPIRKNRQ